MIIKRFGELFRCRVGCEGPERGGVRWAVVTRIGSREVSGSSARELSSRRLLSVYYPARCRAARHGDSSLPNFRHVSAVPGAIVCFVSFRLKSLAAADDLTVPSPIGRLLRSSRKCLSCSAAVIVPEGAFRQSGAGAA
ncbi:hypothetical protein AAFF_G00238020 [Aldrovandia affinis]|uniref:Uncharacterized protein n=1 Tax=Aldrovandia affinis TaxID=143900 RepID=A0AAD7W3Q4_9TELE|nr:hypothetical protein AAFF_G00238020 [Aldrovandia affinis]